MIDERTEELASAYVLGALDPEEGRLFERRLGEDSELRQLVSELRGVSELVAGDSPALEPSAALRTRLLMDFGERVTASRTAPRRSHATVVPWALAASFAGLCLLFGYQSHGLREQLDVRQHRIDELSQIGDTLRAERADLRQAVLSLQQSNRLANMRIAVMSAQLKADPKAVAVSVWDNERQSGVVVVHHLKPPPTDKDYQLWIIDPRYPTPVDAGLLKVDSAGDGRVDFKARRPIENANQFAVTEEIKGGAPVPTLKAMVLAGA
ncbi:MAG TPA: anti-sigma factor [Steroidobacteraceae bacterium]|nr:anti-sigma factor [Steroidobacteraceae bacterium]